MIAAGRNGTKP